MQNRQRKQGGMWRETVDVWKTREKAFSDISSFLHWLHISRMLFLCYSGYPQFPPVPHSQNIFSLFPDILSFSPTGSTFPECFLLFSQTSPVSSASSAFPECFFSVTLDIPSFHPFHISRIFFPQTFPVPSIGSILPECFSLFFQTSPVSPCM